MTKRIIVTDSAPPPAGAYAQAVEASGPFVFISGQTPRLPDGTRLTGAPFEQQARQTMENIKALAIAAGCDLATQCVQMTVYLRDLDNRELFDRVMAEYVSQSPPARAVVQSNLVGTALQVQAVLSR
ncbi:MAG: hypothetical protein JWQ89_3383 [Devosia sp.]|uniref:RidA family protein n=1 Tax=Devosia sp. TaxID=1871048 RepID=UPI00261E830F|nr:RidA family protein [Devosia sp.]MDB5541656.1 hypothetical protein [Devosia sp.]